MAHKALFGRNRHRAGNRVICDGRGVPEVLHRARSERGIFRPHGVRRADEKNSQGKGRDAEFHAFALVSVRSVPGCARMVAD